MQRRLLQAELFSFAVTKIRIGRGTLLRQGQAPLRRLLLRIMPSPWRPVPACVRNDIPQAGHSMLPQSKLESDADLVVATANEGGPFSCAGDNHCSDSQIHPLKSRITAAPEPKRGQSLQRFPSLPPEIRNHCTQQGINRENRAAIPKFTPSIQESLQRQSQNAGIPCSDSQVWP